MKTSTNFSPEIRERAIRLVREHQHEYESEWATICAIAAKIGCTAETLRRWVRPAEKESGARGGDRRRAGTAQGPGAGGAGIAPSRRELAQGVSVFCPGGARPPLEAMKAFIDEHRPVYGVEPIRKVLPIAPSTYRLHAARQADPSRRSARDLRDERLCGEIRRVGEDHFQV